MRGAQKARHAVGTCWRRRHSGAALWKPGAKQDLALAEAQTGASLGARIVALANLAATLHLLEAANGSRPAGRNCEEASA